MDVEALDLYGTRLDPRRALNPLCCTCSHCSYVIQETSHWTEIQKNPLKSVNIKLGDRVLVQGTHTGVVKYAGDLDSNFTNDAVFIGVKLDDPVGTSDGVYQGKRFFQCPASHGVIVPLQHIQLLAPREGCKVRAKIKRRADEIQQQKTDCILCDPSIKKRFDGKYGGRRNLQEIPSSDYREPESSEYEEPDRDATRKEKINLPKFNKTTPRSPRTQRGPRSPGARSPGARSPGARSPGARSPGPGPLKSPRRKYMSTRNAQDLYGRAEHSAPQAKMKVGKASSTLVGPKVTTSQTKAASNKIGFMSDAAKDTTSVTAVQSKGAVGGVRRTAGSELAISSVPYYDFNDSEFSRELQLLEERARNEEDFFNDPDYSRILLSGLSVRDGETPPPQYSTAVDKVQELKEQVQKWGGGERGFHMALTLQKLCAAKLKGEREMEWQKELHQMDTDAEFVERKRVIDSLKEAIIAARKRVLFVEDKVHKLQQALHAPNNQKEIAELKLQIQKLQKKNNTTLESLYHHPIGNSEFVKQTIARITKEYHERKKIIANTKRGHALLQSC